MPHSGVWVLCAGHLQLPAAVIRSFTEHLTCARLGDKHLLHLTPHDPPCGYDSCSYFTDEDLGLGEGMWFALKGLGFAPRSA